MYNHTVEITFREALYLSDALSCHAEGPKGQGSAYPDLLLKLGSAILQADPESSPVGEKPAVMVAFSWPELWIIREAAKTSAAVGQERVGFNLLRKVYRALQTLSAEMEAGSALAAPTADVAEPNAGNVKQRLRQQWKGGGERNATD